MYKTLCIACKKLRLESLITSKDFSEVNTFPTKDGGITYWRYICPTCNFYQDLPQPLEESKNV